MNKPTHFRALLALAQNPNPADADTLAEYAHHIEESKLPAIPEAGLDLRQNTYALPFSRENIKAAAHTINLRIAASRALAAADQHDPNRSYLIQQIIATRRNGVQSSNIEVFESIFTLASFARPTELEYLLGILNGFFHTPTRPFPEKDQLLLAPNAAIPGSALKRTEISRNDPIARAQAITQYADTLSQSLAALALGTYLHNHDDPLPPFYARQTINQSSITGTLIRYANEDDTPSDIRNAAVLALGIADDPRVIPHLMSAANLGSRIDKITTAYSLLSLAMLGERAVLQVAANTLRPPSDRLNMQQLENLTFNPQPLSFESILANRAVIQAIGILHDPEAAPTLIGQYGQNLWTDIEIATALNRSARYEITNDLITLTQSQNPATQLSAIWSLGALHEPQLISPLHRLTNNQSPWLLLSSKQFLYARHIPPFKLTTEAERYLSQHPSYHLASPGNWAAYASPLLFNHPLRSSSHPHY